MIDVPGAEMSTHEPQFEKPERQSFVCVAPTVRTFASLDGEKAHASRLLLPAAATIATPLSTASASATVE